MADESWDVETVLTIAHPSRRRVLRALVDCGEALDLRQLARSIDLPLATVRYHADVLCRLGAAEPATPQTGRDRNGCLYDATVADDPRIEALLEETREADDAACGTGEDA